MDSKEVKRGYRFSSLKNFLVLGAEVCFDSRDKAKIRQEIRKSVDYRIKTQVLGNYSAGCVFKNPEQNLPAGKLIEEVGLKGLQRGGALVSFEHANFIVNKNRATSSDVVFLIEYIKEKVYDKFGLVLEEEIERWGC